MSISSVRPNSNLPFEIVSVSPVEKSGLNSVFRKLTKRHDGLYVRLHIKKYIESANGSTPQERVIRVRIVSSGKNTKTDKMRKLFNEAIRVEAKVEGADPQKTAIHFLDPKSLKKHLLETDLIDSNRRGNLGQILSNNKGSLLKGLNNLHNEENTSVNSTTRSTITSNGGASPQKATIVQEFLKNEGVEISEGKFGSGGMGVVSRGEFEGNDVAVKIIEITDKKPFGELIDKNSLKGEGLGLCLSDKKTKGSFVKFRLIVVDIYDTNKLIERRAIRTEGDFYRLPPNSFIVATVADLAGAAPTNQSDFSFLKGVRAGRQAAEGLAALHAQGIVHHDFKLGNCVIDEQGRLRLIDLGLSRYLGKRGTTNSRAGTPGYLAPEIISETPHDYKADSWSLGITLLYFLVKSNQKGVYGHCFDQIEYNINKVRKLKKKNADAIQNNLLDNFSFQKGPNKTEVKDKIEKNNRKIDNKLVTIKEKRKELFTLIDREFSPGLFSDFPPNEITKLRKIVVALLNPNPKLRMSAKTAARGLAAIERNLQRSPFNKKSVAETSVISPSANKVLQRDNEAPKIKEMDGSTLQSQQLGQLTTSRGSDQEYSTGQGSTEEYRTNSESYRTSMESYRTNSESYRTSMESYRTSMESYRTSMESQ